jgi:tetratricopeptide (TPR) repeat protein
LRTRLASAAALVLLLCGCVYYNAIYNAERAFLEGERLRGLGRDSLAAERYRDVVRKAATGFRQDPGGAWADDALYLLGRARFRDGSLDEAAAALRDARERTDDPGVRHGADVYLGAIEILRGDAQAGLEHLNRAMAELSEGPALAEGHLWRARVLVRGEHLGGAWWDLDRAGALDEAARVPAALERIRWGIHHREATRAREGVERLLSYPEGGAWRDSLETLLHGAAGAWGGEAAVSLLDAAPEAAWDRTERGRVRLARTRLLHDAGSLARAREEAWAVASGIGPSAAEARLLLARWHLAAARDLVDAREVIPILLPAEEDSRVADLLGWVSGMLELADPGREDPLSLFAAGELARDELGAPALARGLFLAYADGQPEAPWVPKALLAALDVSGVEEDRAWIRRRLGERAGSPYVLAARGSQAPGLHVLEKELSRRIRELRAP